MNSGDGAHYEVKGSEITKYYFAGAERIAVRKYVVPQTTTLTYLLGDHLGSTSLAVDASTGAVTETRYKAWGEVRYTTPSKTLPTRFTFTSQCSYVSDEATDLGSAGFGLIFYQSRFYDPALGRMTQADSIAPGGVQGLDRYAYVGNSPLNYIDPSGHKCEEGLFAHEECDDGYTGEVVPSVAGDFYDVVETKGMLDAIYWLANYYHVNLPPGDVWRFLDNVPRGENGQKTNGITPAKTGTEETLKDILLLDNAVYITNEIINRAIQIGDMTLILGTMLHEGWHAWVEYTIESKPANNGTTPDFDELPYDGDLFGLQAWEVDADNAALAAGKYGIELSPLTVDLRAAHQIGQGFPDGLGSANAYLERIYGITLPSYSMLYGIR